MNLYFFFYKKMTNVLTPIFNELCRLCANKINVLMGTPIFEPEGDAKQIPQKIASCLPVEVSPTDKLPKMVCENCAYKLDMMFEFREQTVKTECLLSKLLKEGATTEEDVATVMSSSVGLDLERHVVVEDEEQRPAAVATMHELLGGKEDMAVTSMQQAMARLPSPGRPPAEHPHASSVKYEPDIIIKIEESNHLQLQPGRVQLKTESAESENDEIAADMAPPPLPLENGDMLEPRVALDSASTIQGVHRLSHCEITSNTFEVNEGLMNPAANGLLMLSCPQKTESLEQTTWYFCNVCSKAFDEQDEFQLHFESHCNKCDLCGALFTNEEALLAHGREMHAHKSVKAETGFSQGGGEKAVAAARRKKWEPKVCPECGKHYRTNYKLTEHMRKHTGEKPYKCTSCPKAFRYKIGLAQHEAKHTGQYDFTCNTCGKGFHCRSYLTVHQRVHSDLKPYPCTTCGRNFTTKQVLSDHQNRHLGVKPYLCETCGMQFFTKGLCKSHQRVHSGKDNKQYPCMVCNKLFVNKSNLAKHLRIHTGEKPFMCEVCGKCFLAPVDLRIHSTMHTGEKSFVCEWCGKAFARRDGLRCHRRSHTGERPYRCDICGQGFTEFSSLTIHKRLHTGERPYPCDICGKAFVSRSTMSAHRKKHHV